MLTERAVTEAVHEHFASQLPGGLPDRLPDEQTGDEYLYEFPKGAHEIWYPDAEGQSGVVLAGMAEGSVRSGQYYSDASDIVALSHLGLQPALTWLGVSVHEASFVVRDQYFPEDDETVHALALRYPSPVLLQARANALLRAEGNGIPHLQFAIYANQTDPKFDFATLRAALRTGHMLMASEPHMYLHDLTHVIAAYGVAEALPQPLEDLTEYIEALASLPGLVGAVLCDAETDDGSVSRAFWHYRAGVAEGEALETLFAGFRQRIVNTPQRLAKLALAA